MPLEIREMILRTTLTGNTADNSRKNQAGEGGMSEANTEYIIAECMERLREWLKEENER